MKRVFLVIVALLVLVGAARAQNNTDAAADSAAPVKSDPDFYSKVDLSALKILAVQHQQTIKTLDSYARQTISDITGHSSIDGHSALFTVFDMSFRPEAYKDRPLIKVKHLPLREEIAGMKGLDEKESARIMKEGTVSLPFYRSAEMQQLVSDIMQHDLRKAEAVQQVESAAYTLAQVLMGRGGFPPIAVVAPATVSEKDAIWHSLGDVEANVPEVVQWMQQQGIKAPAPLPNYETRTALLRDIVISAGELEKAWHDQNAEEVNSSSAKLAELLPQINPGVYPSEAKRKVEVVYNGLAKMTIPGAFFYFFAFVLFLMAARSGVASLRLWGLRLFVIALLIHTSGIGIRWWLVGSIPIKNMFESVMFSSWFGAVVGFVLELRRGRSLFGAAASFVGWLALVALFTVPLVLRDIGQEIGQVNGVLMSYWLYIHVTSVTASYAMIGMGFVLSLWWLIKYYATFGWEGTKDVHRVSSDVANFDDVSMSGSGVGVMSFGQTIARLMFMPVAREEAGAKRQALSKTTRAEEKSTAFLASLDACNLVVLQLAFWVLGFGIICGAIWADESWGRPWGWDPKETFALVTWIVYLIVVHMRVATQHKAWWTAVLSVIGFFIMLFNWIGVNFFLVGLHSYA